MSKIGRRPIDLGDVQIEVKGSEVHIKGKNASSVHVLPDMLSVQVDKDKKQLKLMCKESNAENNRVWGLHRALLSNKIVGADKGFVRELNITGLGYKGVLSGNKVVFSLGFSHKIDFPVPQGISFEIDKTGQVIKIKGTDKEQLGLIASRIRSLRPPEPYKATGIKFAQETILRKAGKS
ncbi:MAG: 50S ribosomal protein L6 [Candidatus Babeliales bacterium]